ncbi:MAG: PAS domain S-box protein [Crenarchaeota archaeon]|nr:PAS domain S-box protein [Thermoproteota archaeon]
MGDSVDKYDSNLDFNTLQSLYRSLVEESIHGVAVIMGNPPRIVFANSAFINMLGFSSTDLSLSSVKNVLNFFSAYDREKFVNWLEGDTQKKSLNSLVEVRLFAKNGVVKWFSLLEDQIQIGTQVGRCLLIDDITVRKEEQEGLIQREERYRMLFSGISEGYALCEVIVDKINNPVDFRYLDVNSAYEKLALIKREDIVGKTVREVFPHIESCWVEILGKVALTGEPAKFDYYYPDAQKSFQVYSFSPALRQFAMLLVDVTQAKEKEKQDIHKTDEVNRIIDGISDFLFVLDKDYHVVRVNKSTCSFFNKTPGDFLGKHCYEVVHGTNEPWPTCPAKYTFEKKITHTEEVLDSNINAPLLVTTSPISDEKGEVIQCVHLAKDITEYKKVQDDIKASEAKFRAYVEKSPIAIFVADTSGKYEYVNDAACALLGYSRDEFLEMDFMQLVCPQTDYGLNNYNVGSHDGSYSGEVCLKNKKCETVYVIFSTVFLPDKKMLISCENITDRKIVEQALKEEKEKLEAVTDNISAGLALISRDYQILWMNNYLRKIGVDQSKPCYDMFTYSNEPCSECGLKKIFDGAPVHVHELYVKELDDKGLPHWFEVMLTPIKDDNGKIVAALELTRNITLQKALQKQVDDYSKYLEVMVQERTAQLKDAQSLLLKVERLAAIGQVAAMVGHDLRNPLTGIGGAAFFLRMKLGENTHPKITQTLDLIEANIQYSNKIITDLMDYSKEIRLELSDISPKAIVAEALLVTNVPDAIEIVDLTEDLPVLKMDIVKMKRVFGNFIKNAIDAMASKGGKLEISSKVIDNMVVFKFIDNGVGMTQAVLDKIWTPFFTTKAKGMGLGLAICRRIIDAHEGKIFVESKTGEGTTFTIVFPIDFTPRDEEVKKNE